MIHIPRGTRVLINTGIISSGKSTLINAFAGQEVMETSNLSCTSKACFVVDYLRDDAERNVHLVDSYKKDKLPFDDSTFVRVELPRISRKVLNVAIIDTPGVNDALKLENRGAAYDVIRQLRNATIVFVSNPIHCGTDDDAKCLKNLAEIMCARKDKKWFAVLNGWDLVNPRKDTPEKYAAKINIMAEQYKLPKPYFFYVSSLAALLARRALDSQHLTDEERVKL